MLAKKKKEEKSEISCWLDFFKPVHREVRQPGMPLQGERLTTAALI